MASGKRSTKNDQVTYGPFEDVEPFDDGGELRVHYVSFGKMQTNLTPASKSILSLIVY